MLGLVLAAHICDTLHVLPKDLIGAIIVSRPRILCLFLAHKMIRTLGTAGNLGRNSLSLAHPVRIIVVVLARPWSL